MNAAKRPTPAGYPVRGNAIALHAQPEVLPEYALLARGYLLNELSLDLYGYPADEDGDVQVQDVTLAGSPVSIGEFISRIDFIAMSDFVSRAVETRNKEANEEMRVAAYAEVVA
jgi:hypothetical protein